MKLPPPSERPSEANDPLGCLFDLFTYALLLTAGFCAWTWWKAGEGELPALDAELIRPETVRWVAVGFFILCLLGVAVLRLWGLRLYRRLRDE